VKPLIKYKNSNVNINNNNVLTMLLGLPVPIVATAAGIANDHYGSEDRLVFKEPSKSDLCIKNLDFGT